MSKKRYRPEEIISKLRKEASKGNFSSPPAAGPVQGP
jgi:hypothetical protein